MKRSATRAARRMGDSDVCPRGDHRQILVEIVFDDSVPPSAGKSDANQSRTAWRPTSGVSGLLGREASAG